MPQYIEHTHHFRFWRVLGYAIAARIGWDLIPFVVQVWNAL